MEFLREISEAVARLLEGGVLNVEQRKRVRPLLMRAYILTESTPPEELKPEDEEVAAKIGRELDEVAVQASGRPVPPRTGSRLPWPVRIRPCWERDTSFSSVEALDFGGAVLRRAQWMIDRAEALARSVEISHAEPRPSELADRLDLELVTGEAEYE